MRMRIRHATCDMRMAGAHACASRANPVHMHVQVHAHGDARRRVHIDSPQVSRVLRHPAAQGWLHRRPVPQGRLQAKRDARGQVRRRRRQSRPRLRACLCPLSRLSSRVVLARVHTRARTRVHGRTPRPPRAHAAGTPLSRCATAVTPRPRSAPLGTTRSRRRLPSSSLCSRRRGTCPVPHAPCPMPHAPCPMPHAASTMPHAACPMPLAHASCPMAHALCTQVRGP